MGMYDRFHAVSSKRDKFDNDFSTLLELACLAEFVLPLTPSFSQEAT